MEIHCDFETALEMATGDHSSIHPKRTTKKGENDIEPENESPMLEGSNVDTGELKGELLLQVLAG